MPTAGVRAAALVTCVVCAIPALGVAEPTSTHAHFRGLTTGDVRPVQVHLSWETPSRNAGLAPMSFAVRDHPIDFRRFDARLHPDLGFEAADGTPLWEKSFNAAPAEMLAFIRRLETIPLRVDTTDASVAKWMMSVVDVREDQTYSLQASFDTGESRALWAILLEVFAGNPDATRWIRSLGCASNAMPLGSPAPVDTEVSVVLSGLRPHAAGMDSRVGQAWVTNTGSRTIPGPVYVQFESRSDIRIEGGPGLSCRMGRPGHPYVALTGEDLPPGATITRVLRITGGSGEKLGVRAHVFAGPGTP
jgi:hypothetical protein